MTAADRKSKLGRTLGTVLAMTWALALLLIAWQWIRPSPATDGFRKGSDRSHVVGNAIASKAVELAPTSLPLPGGSLPIQPADRMLAAQVPARIDGLDHSAGSAPERLPDQVAGRSLADNSAPDASAGAPAANRPIRLPSEADASANHRSDLDAPSELLGDKWGMPASWGALGLREVARLLRGPDPTLAAAAQEELQRRGIVGPLVYLARLAGDADPAVRREFVESLPTISGVDARPWLLELSYDDDPRAGRGGHAHGYKRRPGASQAGQASRSRRSGRRHARPSGKGTSGQALRATLSRSFAAHWCSRDCSPIPRQLSVQLARTTAATANRAGISNERAAAAPLAVQSVKRSQATPPYYDRRSIARRLG